MREEWHHIVLIMKMNSAFFSSIVVFHCSVSSMSTCRYLDTGIRCLVLLLVTAVFPWLIYLGQRALSPYSPPQLLHRH